MKTAMQELMRFVDSFQEEAIHPRILRVKIKELLEKEKEQICNAYTDGAKGGANGTKGQHEFGYVSIQIKEKYYNQTYNKPIL